MDLPQIRLLPPNLRDQIAAGEVVERPASVVKELVENALDAGARTVRVEIDGGGLDRILVVDDGHGMDREGALMALQRHATSKIAAFDDLYHLSTFGFRGEAIPSIAAVSRAKITTRPADALAAIEVTAGEPPTVREVGAPGGTSIEIAELFYNVPARRKFLKSVGTESGHVSDVCVDLALVRPDLALTLVRDGKVARQWLRAPDRAARGRDVMTKSAEGTRGPELAHVVGERGSLRVEALLSPPERARAGATGLHLLVNGRAVRDRQLARAVAMAYGSVLDPGRYPVGVVWVDLPSEELDVNVHPQKAEVRFARGREAFDDVTRAIMARLGDAFRSPPSASFLDSSVVSNIFPAPETEDLRGTVSPATERLSSAMASTPGGDPWGISGEERDTVPPTRAGYAVSSRAQSTPPAEPMRLSTTLASADVSRITQEQARLPSEYGSLRFLAQVRSTYLLCEGRDAIYVIDQHAAAERVTFARLREGFAKRAVQRQQLLVPEVVNVRSAESALIDEAREELLGLGVDARAIGDGKVAVHGVPSILARRASPERILRDVLDELAKTGERKFGDAVDLVLATMACHGSVRAGDTLHPDECNALLRDLDAIDFAGYCPHGRPIVTVLPYMELEKKVGRR
ncbi:MAG: DNA mismatch repair endonuclease MutL [Polyangiales bacterium]